MPRWNTHVWRTKKKKKKKKRNRRIAYKGFDNNRNRDGEGMRTGVKEEMRTGVKKEMTAVTVSK